ncbi:MAG: DUF2283 domain-containing protein [Elusimicrobia bacterium]|nr:DUF2283 domain-containing protein [Elusimicrobiota bacterium]
MEIQIDSHTLERAEERGTDEREIPDVLQSGTDIPAKYGGNQNDYGDRIRVLRPVGRTLMQVNYNDRNDLLYIRLDDRKREIINRRISEDVVLDIGEGDVIVGIEVLNASKHLSLERLLPVKYTG